MFHGAVSSEVIRTVFHGLLQCFSDSGAPKVHIKPSICRFSLDGPGADGLEGDDNHFLGCYTRFCPRLSQTYRYCVYSVCLSSTLVDLPFDTYVPAISFRIRPQHWVRTCPFCMFLTLKL